MKSTENMTGTEIFQEIAKRQVLALMFHDSMYDLYSFLNLSGFKCWHKHQYLVESEEFLNTKKYFIDTHNKLLDIDNTGQPKSVIPDSWYGYTRFDVTPQVVKQHVEASFNAYKAWEEESKHLYESCAKSLFDIGRVADSQKVKELVQDVTEELDELYKVMLKLKTSNYDIVYILELQPEFDKKFKKK